MSLRYAILSETVLKGLSREPPIFGNPETREAAARSMHPDFEPSRTDAENRVTLQASARAFARNLQGISPEEPAGGAEFYAVNVMSIFQGAVTSVVTRWISVAENVSLDAAEKLIGQRERGNGADETAFLSVNVEFEGLRDEIEVAFVERDGNDTVIRGALPVGALRRMATARA